MSLPKLVATDAGIFSAKEIPAGNPTMQRHEKIVRIKALREPLRVALRCIEINWFGL
jgi:hypothetical protein